MTSSSTRNPFTAEESPAVGVTLENLSKQFGKNIVLKDISLQIEPGEIFVLMGPSGSGKSVLLKHIVGLEAPTSGRVIVDSQDAADPETREEVKIALVFQAGALFNSLSVYDNLALYLREHRLGNEAAIREKVMHALQILSLESAGGKFPSELSGGMRKRVAIARALVLEPKVLLCDESVSMLDAEVQADVLALLRDLQQRLGLGLLFVTHDLSVASGFCHRVIVLDGGVIVEEGPGARLLSHPQAAITRKLVEACPRLPSAA